MTKIKTNLLFTHEQFEKLKEGKPSTMDSKFGFSINDNELLIFRGGENQFTAKIKKKGDFYLIDEFEVVNFVLQNTFENKLLFDSILNYHIKSIQ